MKIRILGFTIELPLFRRRPRPMPLVCSDDCGDVLDLITHLQPVIIGLQKASDRFPEESLQEIGLLLDPTAALYMTVPEALRLLRLVIYMALEDIPQSKPLLPPS